MTTKAKIGNSVAIEFTGTLDNGEVFGSTTSEEPLRFTLGNQEVLPGVEQAVLGMAPGEKKSTKIPPDQAFGNHDEANVLLVARDRMASDVQPEVGRSVTLQKKSGEEMSGKITDIQENAIEVDCNHPLAGKTLNLDITLIEIT